MGFLQAASAVPNKLQAIDPDKAQFAIPAIPGGTTAPAPFGAGIMPQISSDTGPVDVSAVDTSLGPVSPAIPERQNFFQRLGFGENRRGSALDIIGRLADTVATVGGADALYQPTLNAQEDRERAIAQADLNNDWQEKFNQQKYGAGEEALGTAQRGRIGDVLAAVAGAEDPNAAWGMLADATGLPPEKAAQVGALLKSNPAMASRLATAFGYTPAAQGSAPREVQLYQLAKAENPNLKFSDFLTTLETTKDALTPYQKAQLEGAAETRRDNRQFRQDSINVRREAAAAKASASGVAGGGVEMTKQQRGNVNMKLRTLPNIERQLAEVERLGRDLDGYNSGFVAGRIPGGLNAKADAYDKAVSNLQAQIRQVTRTPGEGSMSDYETRLNSATLPDRTSTGAGRAQSISDLRALIGGIKTGYEEMIGTPAAAPARPARKAPPPRRSTPAPAGNSGGWKIIGVK